MTKIPVKRKPKMPWWAWLLIVLAIIVLIWLLWGFFAGADEPGAAAMMAIAPVTLASKVRRTLAAPQSSRRMLEPGTDPLLIISPFDLDWIERTYLQLEDVRRGD